ncbi:MAG: calcium/sodium antiporter [bacterium]
MTNWFLLAIGFILLVKGADWLVEGASGLALRLNVSDLAVGLTVVAFGTSTPEMIVNIFASIQQHQDIAVGNIIGSNIFNLLVILGITGLIMPLVVQSSTTWKEIPFSLAAVAVLFFQTLDIGTTGPKLISRIDGFILLTLFCGFLFYIYKVLAQINEIEALSPVKTKIVNLLLFIGIGITALVIGGRFVVKSAVQLAQALGVSQKIIGLTLVATGTSLPELMTSVVAAFKKKDDIAIGNIIGSNIFNILFILGISAIIRPIIYDPLFNTDLIVLSAGTIFLFIAMFTGEKKRLDRWEAGVLLAGYVGYLLYLIAREG